MSRIGGNRAMPVSKSMHRARRAVRFVRRYLSTVLCLALLPVVAKGQEPQVVETNEIARLDAVLDESSGLAIHSGRLWTHNDSGDDARLFELDSQGNILRQVTISNALNIDWEAMASDADYLYIADTGNNANIRSTFIIYRLTWESLQAETAEAEVISVTYADHVAGNPLRHNFDAEGLAVRGDELWLFSKNRGDRNTRLYRFPKVPGHYRPESAQTLPVNALVTGADIHPQTGELILLGARSRQENFIWRAPTSDRGIAWEQARLIRVEPSDQWEAIHFDPENSGRIYLTHENSARNYAGLSSIELDTSD